jgi:hypothetical protein
MMGGGGLCRYCSFTNNCHNFSNDLVEFLTGKYVHLASPKPSHCVPLPHPSHAQS